MIFYHGLWDLVYLYGVNLPWFTGPIGFIWQQYICWSFILISGFCQSFAKNGLRDGIIVSLCGIAVSVVTYFVGSPVVFGVLTFLGAAMIFTYLLKKDLLRIEGEIGLFIAFLLFLLTRNINDGYLGFGPINILRLPPEFYPQHPGYFLTFLGFTARSFMSSDYFSFIPWIFLFLSGFYAYKTISKSEMEILNKGKVPFLDFLGRNSLLIYLIHQPILYLLFELIYR